MKIRLTEAQIKMLSENPQQQGTGAVINALSDTNKTQTAITNVNKLKNAIDTLKTSMKTENTGDDDYVDDADAEEEELPARKMEIQDHIDDLLRHVYGFTFFKDQSIADKSLDNPNAPTLFPNTVKGRRVPFYPTMSNDEKQNIDSKYGKMIELLKSNDPEKLSSVFISLIRKKQQPSYMGEDNSINDPGDKTMPVNDYIDALLKTHPNGLKLNTALETINDFEPLPAAKLYRVLGGLVQRGKLTFDSGKPVGPENLDYIVNTSYLSKSNMKTGKNTMFKTMMAPHVNEAKLDFILGKPIELKQTLHTVGKYNQSTKAMEPVKKETIIKGIIEEITDEKLPRMIVKYKTEQGSNAVVHIFYNRGKNEFSEAESSYHISYEGLTDKDNRILDLFKANYYSEALSENNFENSEMFRIIAEAERPRLTKQDFINFLKKKKNEK